MLPSLPYPQKAELAEIASLFDLWNSTLQTGEPEKVASLYAPDGILLPTVSNKVRTDHAGKVDYFTAFLKLKPFGVIDQSIVRFLTPEKDVASNSGIYTFTLQKEEGPVKVGGAAAWVGLPAGWLAYSNSTRPAGGWQRIAAACPHRTASGIACHHTLLHPPHLAPPPLLAARLQVQARYSFVYRKIDGEWKITEHHSSAMPEPVVDPLEEVAAQFDLWNSTLQTGDPEKVASLYAPDGVLLPTVSNKVRPDHASKVDYFTAFLKLKPFGTINESHVRFLNPQKTLAANSGVYTFKLQKEDGPAEVRLGALCWAAPGLRCAWQRFGATCLLRFLLCLPSHPPSASSAPQVQARYSYIYRKIDGVWKIAEHHSSAMPEPVAAPAAAKETVGEHRCACRCCCLLHPCALAGVAPLLRCACRLTALCSPPPSCAAAA